MNAETKTMTSPAARRLPLHADICIGGTGVRMHTDSAELINVIGQRFAGFLAPLDSPEYQFDIELLPLQKDGSDEDVSIVHEGPMWQVRRGDFMATWDDRTRHGNIRQMLSPYALDTILRIIYTLLLAREGGMLMHASSVVRNGRAYIFTGVSGAGKTTISRLAPTDTHVLTDEMSFIRLEPEGYVAYGTPFAGELARPGENIRAPLAGIFLLRQGAENRIDDVSEQDAVRGLMGNILFLAQDPDLVNAVFDSAIALAARVPVRRLTFLPDQRVWDLIGNDA